MFLFDVFCRCKYVVLKWKKREPNQSHTPGMLYTPRFDLRLVIPNHGMCCVLAPPSVSMYSQSLYIYMQYLDVKSSKLHLSFLFMFCSNSSHVATAISLFADLTWTKWSSPCHTSQDFEAALALYCRSNTCFFLHFFFNLFTTQVLLVSLC